jgi:sugar phosphate isomerase/epimerase
MKLAISNLAWPVSEDAGVVELLNRLGVDSIDICPGKYFPVAAMATDLDIERVAAWWRKRGIAITGMQALLFGTRGFNMFGSPEIQAAMLEHIESICRIGAGVGATRLVFGSPKNRDRFGLSDEETKTRSVNFFNRLGEIAERWGEVICLEPNPVWYGANFMTTSRETAQVVRDVGHPSIRMQLDTGAMMINHEAPESLVEEIAPLIGYIHASEPDLVLLGEGEAYHDRVASELRRYLPDHIVSIEMLPPKNEPCTSALERVLRYAIEHYGSMTQIDDSTGTG